MKTMTRVNQDGSISFAKITYRVTTTGKADFRVETCHCGNGKWADAGFASYSTPSEARRAIAKDIRARTLMLELNGAPEGI